MLTEQLDLLRDNFLNLLKGKNINRCLKRSHKYCHYHMTKTHLLGECKASNSKEKTETEREEENDFSCSKLFRNDSNHCLLPYYCMEIDPSLT